MGLFNRAPSLTESQVLEALTNVIDPDFQRDVVSLGMIKDVRVSGKDVSFTFELTTPACPLKDRLEREAREAVLAAQPDARVSINMTARVTHSMNAQSEAVLPGVKNTIAVASGKGGVGKSTVAANLAAALAKQGAKVGLLDADIYGPSIPMMFGLHGSKPGAQQIGDKVKMIPLTSEGIRVISIGFMIDPDQAVVWRGPMAAGALKQFITDTYWGDLDYLIFDLPPGTGDIQLTLVQTLPLTGALIVTTPQDVALADAKKAIRMFEKVHVPVLGIVENMSYFVCKSCGTREEIFSHGGGRSTAEEYKTAFLGELPIQTSVRAASDAGRPVVLTEPQSPAGRAFFEIAQHLAQQVSIRNLASAQETVEITL